MSNIVEVIDRVGAFSSRFREAENLYRAVEKEGNPWRVPIFPTTWYVPSWPEPLIPSFKKYLEDPEVHLETQLQGLLWRLETFPLEDVRLVNPTTSRGTLVRVDFGTMTVVSVFCQIVLMDDDLPGFPVPALQDIKEVANMKVPEPSQVPWVQRTIEFYECMKERIESIDDRLSVDARISTAGVFSDAALIRGQGDFLMDLTRHPQLCKNLLQLVVETTIELNAYLWKKTGLKQPEEYSFSDDLVCVISPSMYEEFAAPYEQLLAQKLTRKGTAGHMHLCGKSGHLLPSIRKCLNPREMEISYLTDLSYARKVMPDAILYGNVNPRTIAHGSRSQIYDEVKDCLRKGMSNKKFVFMSGTASWDRGTPIENIEYVYQLVRKYGEYPIRSEL